MVSVRRGFSFFLVLRIGCVILLVALHGLSVLFRFVLDPLQLTYE